MTQLQSSGVAEIALDQPLQEDQFEAVLAFETSPEELVVDLDGHTHLLTEEADEDASGAPLARADGSRLCLFDIDDLLEYHYDRRVALARGDITQRQLDAMSKTERGDWLWTHLFRDTSSAPFDEGRVGILEAMKGLGLNVNASSLSDARTFFRDEGPAKIRELCLKAAGVRAVVGTQSILDDTERGYYELGRWSPCFQTALRADDWVLHWRSAVPKIGALGYDVNNNLQRQRTLSELRRMHEDWLGRLKDPRYIGCSFSPDDRPDDISTSAGRILHEVILPICQDRGLPFFAMPGPYRGERAAWRDAGDGVGFCDFTPYRRLVQRWDRVGFLLTPLHESNQHDATVLACHQRNVMPIGHWWHCLQPAHVRRTLSARLQALAGRFVAFNSDSRVWPNMISKWIRFRRILAEVMLEMLRDLHRTGYTITRTLIRSTLRELFELDRFKLLEVED